MLPHVVAALLLAHTSAHASGMRARVACDTIAPASADGSGQVYLVAPGNASRVAWTDARPNGMRGAKPAIVFVRDARGATHAVGRAGAGPGEFRIVSMLTWTGDTLWVSDGAQQRIQAFNDGGKFLTGHPVTTRAALTRRSGDIVIAIEPVYVLVPGRPHEIGADPLAIVATQPSGRADTLLRIEPMPLIGDPLVIPELYQKLLIRGSVDGEYWCGIVRAATTGLATSCTDASGRPYLRGVQTWSPRLTSDTAWGGAIAAMMRSSSNAKRTDVTGFFHRPAFLPLGFDLQVNRNGELWILRSHPSEPLQIWDRLRRDGTRLPSFTVPGRVQLRALDGNWYYAADTDADDLQTLIRCPIP